MTTNSTLRRLLPIAAFAALLQPFCLAQTPITFGNLVVVRVGDGTGSLTTAAAPVFLDEYTTNGIFVQSIALPTVTTGSNHAFTNAGNATSEAYLNVSSNGLYLLLAGYDAAPGTAAVVATSASTNNRVVARVDFLGNVDTSTALTDAYTTGNIRSAVSDDGNRIWTSGTQPSSGGIRFTNLGGTTTTGINAGAPTNCRTATIYDGQLYTTSASTVYLGVCTVGTGLPTASAAVSLLNGFPTTGSTTAESAYDHFFADPNTLYVADDNSAVGTDGGIQKWTQSGGLWTKQYTLQLAPMSGCRGLSGFVQNGVTTLWATANTSSTGGAQTELVTVVDTGPASVVTSLGTSPIGTAFRGVRYFGLPTTVSQPLPYACGSAGLRVTGNGQVGTDVISTVLNPVGFAFVGYGLTPLGLPFCNCTVAHEFSFLVGGPSHTLALPSTPTLAGTLILVQGLDFLAPGGCPNPLFALTDAYSFTIQ